MKRERFFACTACSLQDRKNGRNVLKKEEIYHKWNEICWSKGIQISLTYLNLQQITNFKLESLKQQIKQSEDVQSRGGKFIQKNS